MGQLHLFCPHVTKDQHQGLSTVAETQEPILRLWLLEDLSLSQPASYRCDAASRTQSSGPLPGYRVPGYRDCDGSYAGSTFHAALGYAWNVAVQKSFINRVYRGGLCHWVRHDPLPALAASSILGRGHWDQVDCKESRADEEEAKPAAVARGGLSVTGGILSFS